MTRLFNDPSEFADQMIEGFVAANPGFVSKAHGGVVRRTRDAQPAVAVVVGGGSGHYPAFGGLVGEGLAHGAVLGNIFASPSAHQVESIARRCDQGRGVLLAYGNYAGDVLNFTAAAQALRADGINCRTVAVTDDIFSAPLAERSKRRGIAGDLAVFKVAGAASAAGLDIAEVERLAQLANDRTRSMGVAFSGCTLPGAAQPLFDVPDGQMAIGLGIHGEPGIDSVPLPTAKGLANLLVNRLLNEIPSDVVAARGQRVVPILNGLGTVKYDELFVVYARVSKLLAAKGLIVVDPQVGEFCTSFDMAGVSLTLLWLTDELEQLWLAPANAPAFRTGATVASEAAADDEDADDDGAEAVLASTEQGRFGASRAVAALVAIEAVIEHHAAELGRLDSVAGDGDHGIGMQRGSKAAVKEAQDTALLGAGTQTVLRRAADAWADRAGGTSGALWAAILRAVGDAIGDTDAPTASTVADGVVAAKVEVMRFGGAAVGDKTMVDALVPFADSLRARVSAGERLEEAWHFAAEQASDASAATASLLPLMGRARSHGTNAVGTPDPGAVSLALIAHAVHTTLAHAHH